MPQQGTGRTLRTHSTGDVLLPPKKVNKRYGVIITHGGESWSERLASNKWTWMMGKRLLWFECPLPNSCRNVITIVTVLRVGTPQEVVMSWGHHLCDGHFICPLYLYLRSEWVVEEVSLIGWGSAWFPICLSQACSFAFVPCCDARWKPSPDAGTMLLDLPASRITS